MEFTQQYNQVGQKADEIESELRRLQSWQEAALPAEKFENMGAFGCNTMTFQQWIQFVLIRNIRDIIKKQEDFPSESQVATYAVRELDGAPDVDRLIQLLLDLDDLINFRGLPDNGRQDDGPPQPSSTSDRPLPSVVYELAKVLHLFEGDDLEAQLQTYDLFLSATDELGRGVISDMMHSASSRATSAESKARLVKAAESVAAGGNATKPYNHEEAMRKYREEFKKSFPDKKD